MISSSEEIFDNSKTIYEDALKKNVFQNKLSQQQNIVQINDEHQEKKKRKRSAIQYNRPYSTNVKKNIDMYSLNCYTSIFQRRISFIKYLAKTLLNLVIVAQVIWQV